MDQSIEQKTFPLKGKWCSVRWIEAFGIEPLRVVQRKPLSFGGDYIGWDSSSFATWILIEIPKDSGILSKINFTDNMKFQVTQILEEDK